MQQAPELESLILQLYTAMAEGDFPTLEQIFSPLPRVLVIGTDPAEWWEGGTVFVEAMRQRREQAGHGMPVAACNPRAFSDGDVGWAADRGVYRLPGGAEQQFRGSFVFLRQNGAWHIVQWHVSFPVDNEEVLWPSEA